VIGRVPARLLRRGAGAIGGAGPSWFAIRGAALLAGALLWGACSQGIEASAGLDEPLRVQGGQLIAGDLPGSPPPVDSAAPPVTPAVTVIDSLNNVLRPGQTGKQLGGRASPGAVTMGVRFADLGSGYWVFAAGGPDPLSNNEITWQATFDIGRDLPPGLRRLRFVPFDDSGRAGEQRDLEVCIASPLPDNLNACDPTIAPPRAVLSLSWDTDVDLDLQVITPGGKQVDPRHPSTVDGSDGSISPADLKQPGVGLIDRDSNGGCVLDRQRSEHLVWQTDPSPGTYQVRANLTDACGQASVRFRVELYLAIRQPDGTERLVLQLEKGGVMTSQDANGGAGPGLFVTEITLNVKG
jgi:hypothetical protein